MGFFISSILAMTYFAVVSKRTSALINIFSAQSFFLALMTLFAAYAGAEELYVVALLLFAVKALMIPFFCAGYPSGSKPGTHENAINPLLSLTVALGLTYLAYLFATR